jgi:hypothetical protein
METFMGFPLDNDLAKISAIPTSLEWEPIPIMKNGWTLRLRSSMLSLRQEKTTTQ